MGMANWKEKAGTVWALVFLFAVTTGGPVDAAVISSGKIKEAVRAYVEKNMPWSAGRVRLFFPARISDIHVPGTGVTCEVRGKRNENFVGDSAYTIRLCDGDTLLRENTVRVRIEVLLDVAVSVRAMEKDSEIRQEDVRFEGRWFGEIPATAVTDFREIEGKLLIRGIRPNCEITKNILKNGTLVRRGRMVRIVLENGFMTVLTSGLSEEDGARHDVVRVRNLSSSKIIYAKVVDENTVRVDY
jgi:flagella basal body P-ring formation protein FlgA